MFYWLMKYVFLGPVLRLIYRPKARGLENIPAQGPVILAANHVSFVDSLFVPVGVLGTRDIQPPEKRIPKLGGRVEVVYGQPLRFDRFDGKDRDRFVLRSVTDEIMYETMMLSGQEYVDEYASKVKARLSEPVVVVEAEAEAPAP